MVFNYFHELIVQVAVIGLYVTAVPVAALSSCRFFMDYSVLTVEPLLIVPGVTPVVVIKVFTSQLITEIANTEGYKAIG